MRIVIVDDDQVVCHALKTIIENNKGIDVIAMGFSYEDALKLYRQFQPDILLMDIRMGAKTGLDAGKAIIEENAQAKILYLTTFLDNEYIIRALNMGAKGYLLKQDFANIVPALQAVFAGQNVFGDEVMSMIPKLTKTFNLGENNYLLTDKEHLIIEEIAQGSNNKEIGEKLYLTEGTVRNYVSSILEKLNLRDRTQIAVFYWKNFK